LFSGACQQLLSDSAAEFMGSGKELQTAIRPATHPRRCWSGRCKESRWSEMDTIPYTDVIASQSAQTFPLDWRLREGLGEIRGVFL
jgi:hypothetical protein